MKSHHLVMVNNPGQQAVEDFHDIKVRIEQAHPAIEVFIANNRKRNEDLERAASLKPTLVMSPMPLHKFKPLRGRIHCGRPVGKIAQLKRLDALGVPVPKWAVASPGLRPGADEWGPYLILKPAGVSSAYGKSMSIVPTAKYRYRAPRDYPEGHIGRKVPMIVQSFIHTGECASSYRVNTLYGEALYCVRTTRNKPLPDLDQLDDEKLSGSLATNNFDAETSTLEFASENDVLELAREAHASFRRIPVKGIDIVRQTGSGRVFVLELNCLSSTWHISSDYCEPFRTGEGAKENIVNQFGAWDVAAKVLAEQTLTQAI